ncbi:MAG: hypothetical protein ACXQTF_04735, partial [Candidatus Hecatellaceae archaeon]
MGENPCYPEVLEAIKTVPGAAKSIAEFVEREAPRPEVRIETSHGTVVVKRSSSGEPGFYGPTEAVKEAYHTGKMAETLKKVSTSVTPSSSPGFTGEEIQELEELQRTGQLPLHLKYKYERDILAAKEAARVGSIE